jgi:hypothetical protein
LHSFLYLQSRFQQSWVHELALCMRWSSSMHSFAFIAWSLFLLLLLLRPAWLVFMLPYCRDAMGPSCWNLETGSQASWNQTPISGSGGWTS